MDNIFKFKKAKKMVGEFDADDQQEWCLLVKPQIGDVTLFVHFHKLWCVTEVPPKVEKNEDGEDEVVEPGVQKQSGCHVYFGFVKDDKFIVERQSNFTERIDELAQKRFVQNLQRYLDEGYKKDWNNYKLDEAVVPNYYGHGKDQGGSNPLQSLHQMGAKMPHKILRGLKSINLGQAQSNNPQTP